MQRICCARTSQKCCLTCWRSTRAPPWTYSHKHILSLSFFSLHFQRKTFIEFIHEFQRVPSKCVLAIFANVSAPGSSVGYVRAKRSGSAGSTGCQQNQQTRLNWLPQGSAMTTSAAAAVAAAAAAAVVTATATTPITIIIRPSPSQLIMMSSCRDVVAAWSVCRLATSLRAHLLPLLPLHHHLRFRLFFAALLLLLSLRKFINAARF